MLNLKRGMPEEGDIVMCTITKIHYHSVFAKLDEYHHKQGLIHISEVSPGRIRNISDYVQEGKRVVCKVLRINQQRGHIDLSLRRVSNIQKRNKVEELKQEQKSEKILEYVAGQNDMKTKELNDIIAPKLLSKYPTLHAAFEDVSFGGVTLEELGVEKKWAEPLNELIKQRIKPPVVKISGEIHFVSFDADGVNITSSILSEADSISEDVSIKYAGGGRYTITVTKNEYKDAEADLKKVLDFVEEKAKENRCEYSYERKESRKIRS
ncbi:MAG: translation initiation factor IF-2 subunit alpha [Candidatus Woesearchaeota archaeon]